MPYGMYTTPFASGMQRAMGQMQDMNLSNQAASLFNNNLLARYRTEVDTAREIGRGNTNAAREQARGQIGAAREASAGAAAPSAYAGRMAMFDRNNRYDPNSIYGAPLELERQIATERLKTLAQVMTGLQNTIGNVAGGLGNAIGGIGRGMGGSMIPTPQPMADPYAQHTALIQLLQQMRGMA